MKKAIFTVNLSEYDFDPSPALGNTGWDRILFTDSEKIESYGWNKIFKLKPTDRPDLKSRKVKWLSHKYLPEYDLVCYHDSNMRVVRELPGCPFRIIHGKRSSVREEADACNRQKHRWTVEAINEQMEYFDSQGFPDDLGLFLNGFFCRRHTEKENELCEEVWRILNCFSSRDQLALPFAMWNTSYTPSPHELFPHRFFKKSIQMRLHKNQNPTIYG